MKKLLIKCTKTDAGKKKDESFNPDKYEIEIDESDEKIIHGAIEEIKKNSAVCCIQDESDKALFESIAPRVFVNYIIIKLNVSKITLWSDEYTWVFEINSRIPVTNNDKAHFVISAKITRNKHDGEDDGYEAIGFFYPSLNASVSNDFQQFGVVPWMVSIYCEVTDNSSIFPKSPITFRKRGHYDMFVCCLDELIKNNYYKKVFSPGQLLLNDAVEDIERNLELFGYGLSEEYLSSRMINRESVSIKDENILTTEESAKFVEEITSLDDNKIFENGSDFETKYKPVISMSNLSNKRNRGNNILNKKKRLEEIIVLLNSTEDRKFSICVHECGHALVTGLLFGWEYVEDVTNIGKRGDYAGRTRVDWEQIESDCARDNNKYYEMAEIYCGGKAAEEIFYGDSSSLAAGDDIYAAADRIIELLMKVPNIEFITEDEITQCTFSNPNGKGMLSCKADEVLSTLLRNCLDDTRKILSDKRDIIRTLACKTLTRDNIPGNELSEIYDSYKKENTFGSVIKEAVATLENLLNQLEIDKKNYEDVEICGFFSYSDSLSKEREVLDKFTKPKPINCNEYPDSQVMQLICEIAGLDLYDDKSVISIKVNEQGEAFYTIDP